MNDSLLREVDEDVRQERMQQLWRRYRKPLMMAVAVIVAFTAGNSLWRDHQSKKAGAAMAQLDSAIQQLEAGNPKDAQEAFKAIANNAGGELHDIALLWQARAHAQSDQPEEAIKTLTVLATKPAGDDLVWRDLACLRLLSANAEVPDACASEATSPLATQRMEWRAAHLWQQGDYDAARTVLTAIIDHKETPGTQRTRAKRLLRALPAKAASS